MHYHYFETCIVKWVAREISVLITKVGSEGSNASLHPSGLLIPTHIQG